MVDIFEVTLQGQVYNQTIKNVIHLRGGTDSFTAQFVAQDVIINFLPYILAKQCTPYVYTFVHAQKISPTRGESYLAEVFNGAASFNDTMMPPAICVLMELFTATRLKTERGRLFVSGLRMAQGTTKGWNEYVEPSFRSMFVSLMSQYGVDTAARPLRWGVWSRKLSQFHDITACRILNRYGVQRRRNINMLS
jgi:hypothetical protein